MVLALFTRGHLLYTAVPLSTVRKMFVTCRPANRSTPTSTPTIVSKRAPFFCFEFVRHTPTTYIGVRVPHTVEDLLSNSYGGLLSSFAFRQVPNEGNPTIIT